MINELYHHGILGMKWGVRRYQNKDGTLTAEGKKRSYYRRRVNRELNYVDDVNSIVNTLSKDEKRKLGNSDYDEWIEKEYAAETVSNIAKTFIQKHGDKPVAMLEIWDDGKEGVGQIAIATDPNYRGTGVTSKNINEAIKWFNSKKNTKLKELQWNYLLTNPKSGQIAEKHGFGDYSDDGTWGYRKMFKR